MRQGDRRGWGFRSFIAGTLTVVAAGLVLLRGGPTPRSSPPAPMEQREDHVAPDVTEPKGADNAPAAIGTAEIDVVRASDDAGIPNADVVITPVPSGVAAPSLRGSTEGDGHVSIPVRQSGVYHVRAVAAGFAESSTFVEIPGRAQLRLQPGATLILHPRPFPDDAWKEWRIRVRPTRGFAREFQVTASALNTGDWPEGVTRIELLRPPYLEVLRTERVALPPDGTATFDVTLPRPTVIDVRVDARGGAPPAVIRAYATDDAALSPLQELKCQRLSQDLHRIALPRVPCVLAFESPGYSRGYLRVDGDSAKREYVLTMTRGATLECKLHGAFESVRVHWLGPDGPETSAVRFEEMFELGGVASEGPLDVSWSQTRLPAASLLAEKRPTDADRTLVFADLPIHSRVLILAQARMRHVTIRATTGDAEEVRHVEVPAHEASSVLVTLRDSQGNPARRVRVNVFRSSGESGKRGEYRGAVQTDVHGRITLNGLRPMTEYRLHVVARLGSSSVLIRAPRENERSEIWLKLPQPTTREVRARVVDEQGRGMPKVLVSFNVVNGPSFPVLTGSEGVATSTVPASARIMVVASRAGERGVVVPLVADGETVVKWTGAASRLVVKIELDGTSTVTVALFRDGMRVRRVEARVDQRGQVEFLGVAPGRYSIRLVGPEGATATETAQVVAGSATRVTLRG